MVQILQTCYFEYFENAWSCPSVMIISPCRKLWWPKCWNQLVRNFDVYLQFISNIFFEILWKRCEHAIFGTLVMLDHCIKIIVSIYSKLSWSSACKKSTLSLTTFLRHCREIANFLFWVVWACLAMLTQSDTINL